MAYFSKLVLKSVENTNNYMATFSLFFAKFGRFMTIHVTFLSTFAVININLFYFFFIRIVLFNRALDILKSKPNFLIFYHRPLPPIISVNCFSRYTLSFGDVLRFSRRGFHRFWKSFSPNLVILIKIILVALQKCQKIVLRVDFQRISSCKGSVSVSANFG